jgi:hypothetical protein
MMELIEFYSKNALHLLLFMSIGFIVAMMDVSFRKIVKKVYLNVRKNIQIRHGGDIQEGLDMSRIDKLEEKTKEEPNNKNSKKGGKNSNSKKKSSDEGDSGGEEGECPKDCAAVVELQKRLTKLITDATKLTEDVKNNNITIQKHERIIAELRNNVNDLVEASNK